MHLVHRPPSPPPKFYVTIVFDFYLAWDDCNSEDVSAFGGHRKFPPHARKTSGSQGSNTQETLEIIVMQNFEGVNKVHLVHYGLCENGKLHNFVFSLC